QRFGGCGCSFLLTACGSSARNRMRYHLSDGTSPLYFIATKRLSLCAVSGSLRPLQIDRRPFLYGQWSIFLRRLPETPNSLHLRPMSLLLLRNAEHRLLTSAALLADFPDLVFKLALSRDRGKGSNFS
ncbi:hypothetical protein L9F63_028209, partial [Diploptera punctata]